MDYFIHERSDIMKVIKQKVNCFLVIKNIYFNNIHRAGDVLYATRATPSKGHDCLVKDKQDQYSLMQYMGIDGCFYILRQYRGAEHRIRKKDVVLYSIVGTATRKQIKVKHGK